MILVHRYRLHLLLMFTYSIAFQMYVSNVFPFFFGLERVYVHFSCDFLFQMCLFFGFFPTILFLIFFCLFSLRLVFMSCFECGKVLLN